MLMQLRNMLIGDESLV